MDDEREKINTDGWLICDDLAPDLMDGIPMIIEECVNEENQIDMCDAWPQSHEPKRSDKGRTDETKT